MIEGEKISEKEFCNECGEPLGLNDEFCKNCGAHLKKKYSGASISEGMIRLEKPKTTTIEENTEKPITDQAQKSNYILYMPPKKKKTETNFDAIISIILALSPLLLLSFFWFGRVVFIIGIILAPILMSGAVFYGARGYKKERLRILALIGIIIGLAGVGFLIYLIVLFMSGWG